jgi:hypothetical protein
MKIKIEGVEGFVDTDFSVDPNTPLDDPNTPPFTKLIASYECNIFGRSEENKFIRLFGSDGAPIGRLSFTKAELRIPSRLLEGIIFIDYVESDFDAVISFLRQQTTQYFTGLTQKTVLYRQDSTRAIFKDI